jgi:hypothetical protein
VTGLLQRARSRVLIGPIPDLPRDPEAAGWRVERPDCPTCGATAEVVDTVVGYLDIPEVMPMWDGGPLVAVPGLPPARRIVESVTTTLGCGHVWPWTEQYVVRYHPPTRWQRMRNRLEARRG